MDEGGARNGTQCRGPLGRAPLLGILDDMLRKMGISLHRGPSMSEGNLESGGELIYQGL